MNYNKLTRTYLINGISTFLDIGHGYVLAPKHHLLTTFNGIHRLKKYRYFLKFNVYLL